MRRPLKAPKRLLQERELYSSLNSLAVLCGKFTSTINEQRGLMVHTRYTFGRKTILVDSWRGARKSRVWSRPSEVGGWSTTGTGHGRRVCCLDADRPALKMRKHQRR